VGWRSPVYSRLSLRYRGSRDRAPELFATLRGIIDDRRAAGDRAGHFLLLGSAALDLMLVRRLRPWSGNVGKRLVRTPKTYVRDSGSTLALLELETWEDVPGRPVAGSNSR